MEEPVIKPFNTELVLNMLVVSMLALNMEETLRLLLTHNMFNSQPPPNTTLLPLLSFQALNKPPIRLNMFMSQELQPTTLCNLPQLLTMLSNLLPLPMSNNLLRLMFLVAQSQLVKLLRESQELNTFLSNKPLLIMKFKNMLREFPGKESSQNMNKKDISKLSQEKLLKLTITLLNI